jgi:hypothetical protein
MDTYGFVVGFGSATCSYAYLYVCPYKTSFLTGLQENSCFIGFGIYIYLK